MLKTNNKEFKQKVRNYILDSIDSNYLIDCGYPASNEEEKIISTFNCMSQEYWNEYEKKRTPNRQEALKEYLLGLPSSFSVEHYYNEQREILKQWFEQTDVESEKYSDDKISDMFYNLITLNFFQMYDKVK